MSKYNMQNVFIWLVGENKKSYRASKWKMVGDTEKIHNCIRLQIENSIKMGWNKKDIIPITNFPIEHMGVKAYEAERFCPWSSFVNKLVVVQEMIEKDIIKDNIWLHDCDCYQLHPFPFPEECKDWGYTRHCPSRSKNQGASGFFRTSGYDIIKTISEEIQHCKPPREESFIPVFYTPLRKRDKAKKRAYVYNTPNKDSRKAKLSNMMVEKGGIFADRFSFMNYTYNLGIVKYFNQKYHEAEKPVKTVHFHIERKEPRDCFYFGKNRYNVRIVTDELEKLLIKYGFIQDGEKR